MEWEKIKSEYSSPLYVYDEEVIISNIRKIQEALSEVPHIILYSLKANSNLNILSIIRQEGTGADVVSLGELKKALLAGFPPENITFAGVGKKKEEIEYAVKQRIGFFVVESFEEYLCLKEISEKLRSTVLTGIRLNPGIDPHTIDKLATGKKGTKFGVEKKELFKIVEDALKSRYIEIKGLHVHIGSQIKTPEPFIHMLEFLYPVWEELKKTVPLRVLDIGGGFAYDYETGKNYAPVILKELIPHLKKFNATVYVEPGRSIVAPAGVLLTEVLYRKKVHGINYVIVDAGMNDFMRVAFYNARHRIENVSRKQGEKIVANVVGPICEPGDILGRDIKMVKPERGDILIIRDTGAYGYSMSGNYNARTRIREILRRKDGRCEIIREGEKFIHLLTGEKTPDIRICAKTGFINRNVANLRRFPDPAAERVNQALFGEKIQILHEFEGWYYVEKEYDRYRGWIRSQYVDIREKQEGKKYIVADLLVPVFNKRGEKITVLPYLSIIYGRTAGETVEFFYGKHEAVIDRKFLLSEDELKFKYPEEIIEELKKFIGVPYLWGGLSPFGIDCSGLVQTVFRRFGIKLTRDTSTQIEEGIPVEFRDKRPLDLIFFPGHVGVYIGNNKYIHSSTRNNGVYIDILTDDIKNTITGIRRVIHEDEI